jgi:hypothetical protein
MDNISVPSLTNEKELMKDTETTLLVHVRHRVKTGRKKQASTPNTSGTAVNNQERESKHKEEAEK